MSRGKNLLKEKVFFSSLVGKIRGNVFVVVCGRLNFCNKEIAKIARLFFLIICRKSFRNKSGENMLRVRKTENGRKKRGEREKERERKREREREREREKRDRKERERKSQ